LTAGHRWPAARTGRTGSGQAKSGRRVPGQAGRRTGCRPDPLLRRAGDVPGARHRAPASAVTTSSGSRPGSL
jgi:hypothetical protein